jgi:hypothetical protein
MKKKGIKVKKRLELFAKSIAKDVFNIYLFLLFLKKKNIISHTQLQNSFFLSFLPKISLLKKTQKKKHENLEQSSSSFQSLAQHT